MMRNWLWFLVVGIAVALPAQRAPKVAKLTPADGATDVDATRVKQLVVTFDKPMNGKGWSFCGGGPKFPEFTGSPRWKNTKTCVVEVALEPDHDYSMFLNCPAGGNFRGADGTKAVGKMWRFSTLPAMPLSEAKQRAQNEKALAALRDVLQARYSYYDLRDLDWPKLFAEHERAILGAKSTRGWAAAAGKMLEPTGDLHLSLRLGDHVVPAGRRAVDPLFRSALLGEYLAEHKPLGDRAVAGRTEDGIGYLMIGGWTRQLDLDAVEAALAEMRSARGLIVDVRPNSGGDESMAQRVAQWFVSGTKVYAKNRYRVGEGENGFGPVLDRAIRGNRDESQRFAGPIVVLTSRYVMSSCEAFVLMMRQAEDCVVVGQPTYGSSGNPKAHELPNGVTAVIPSWQALRPDGTCFEGEGLAPDVRVEVDADVLHKRDPILERGLEVLREKLR